jgi:hypothetical protein
MTIADDRRQQEFVNELKAKVARGEYVVDSGRVAEEILWKLGVVRRLRSSLPDDEAQGLGPDVTERPGARRSRDRGSGRSRDTSRERPDRLS